MSIAWGKEIPRHRAYFLLTHAVRHLAHTRNLEADWDALEACWLMANAQARIAFEAEHDVA